MCSSGTNSCATYVSGWKPCMTTAPIEHAAVWSCASEFLRGLILLNMLSFLSSINSTLWLFSLWLSIAGSKKWDSHIIKVLFLNLDLKPYSQVLCPILFCSPIRLPHLKQQEAATSEPVSAIICVEREFVISANAYAYTCAIVELLSAKVHEVTLFCLAFKMTEICLTQKKEYIDGKHEKTWQWYYNNEEGPWIRSTQKRIPYFKSSWK